MTRNVMLVLAATLVAGAPSGLDAQERDDSGWLETVASDSWHGVRIFADNTWDVVTFPTWMDRAGWLQLGGVVAVGGVLYAFDEDIQDWFEEPRDGGVRGTLDDGGDYFEPLGDMGETNAYLIAGMIAGYLTGWDRLNWFSQDLLFSHFIASLTRKSVRAVVGRYRPEADRGAYHFDPFSSEGTSFPSGHASTAFQLAAVAGHHIDFVPLEVALYGVAGLVAWNRVQSRGHWASDTWIGSAWGWGVARVVLMNGDERRGLIGGARMQVDPATGMLAVSIPLR